MKRAIASAVLFVALAAAGVALAFTVFKRIDQPEDVRGTPTVEFIVTEPEEIPGETIRPEPVVREEPWPTYGFDLRRTRVAADFDLEPPFDEVWMFRGRSLIEFPPVLAYDRAYFGTNKGQFFAVETATGDVVWEKDFKRCIAASPAVANDIVYVSLMDPFPCADHDETAPGFLIALDADTGKRIWRFEAGVNESSPLYVDNRNALYFGTWDNKIYALNAETGEEIWSYETGDDIKSGAAFAKGKVFIGSYDGKVYALNADNGELIWDSEAQGGLFGTGNFYATPTVAYGRVYIGNTDGKVYAFGAETGDLLWSKSTGDWVYSSAAVWDETVYVGSYDDKLYALDAATGDEKWTFEADGDISGSPTVLSGNVYFSTLARTTYGVDARTGEEIWTFPDGQYTPVIADRDRLYLTGHARVYALEPSGRSESVDDAEPTGPGGTTPEPVDEPPGVPSVTTPDLDDELALLPD